LLFPFRGAAVVEVPDDSAVAPRDGDARSDDDEDESTSGSDRTMLRKWRRLPEPEAPPPIPLRCTVSSESKIRRQLPVSSVTLGVVDTTRPDGTPKLLLGGTKADADASIDDEAAARAKTRDAPRRTDDVIAAPAKEDERGEFRRPPEDRARPPTRLEENVIAEEGMKGPRSWRSRLCLSNEVYGSVSDPSASRLLLPAPFLLRKLPQLLVAVKRREWVARAVSR